MYHIVVDYGCSYIPIPSFREDCYGTLSLFYPPLLILSLFILLYYVLLSYIFIAAKHNSSEIIGIKYSLQYNTTGFAVRGVQVNLANYLALPMQKALDSAICTIYILFRIFYHNIRKYRTFTFVNGRKIIS